MCAQVRSTTSSRLASLFLIFCVHMVSVCVCVDTGVVCNNCVVWLCVGVTHDGKVWVNSGIIKNGITYNSEGFTT